MKIKAQIKVYNVRSQSSFHSKFQNKFTHTKYEVFNLHKRIVTLIKLYYSNCMLKIKQNTCKMNPTHTSKTILKTRYKSVQGSELHLSCFYNKHFMQGTISPDLSKVFTFSFCLYYHI